MRDTIRFQVYIDTLLALDEIWGFARVGIELTRAHCDGYAVTADSLAATLKVSDDTARRWLEALVRDAKVWVRIERGRRYYTPVAEFAEQSIDIMSVAERYHPQSAVR